MQLSPDQFKRRGREREIFQVGLLWWVFKNSRILLDKGKQEVQKKKGPTGGYMQNCWSC